MAAAQYGTGYFSTPSDLLTAANQVNAQVQAIDSAINGNMSIPQSWWDAFTQFESTWLAFFSSTFGGQGFDAGNSGNLFSTTASWFTSDVESQVLNFETQTATYAQQAAGYGSAIPSIIQPPSNPTLPSLAGISTTLILLLVLLLVWDFS